MKTTAQKIADALGNGQNFEAADGRTLADLARAHGATVSRPEYQLVIYAFSDGSAIVTQGAAWDLRADGCTEHCWAGAGCQCREK